MSWLTLKAAVQLAGGQAVRLTARAPRDPRTIDGLVPTSIPWPLRASPSRVIATNWRAATWKRPGLWPPAATTCRSWASAAAPRCSTCWPRLPAHGPGGVRRAKLSPSRWDQATARKRVRLRGGSRLAQILGPAPLRVDAIHQQAIDRLGVGLTVAAREANGLIQAIEDRSRRFWIGVQYHPELLLYRSRHRRLFKALVEAARIRRNERMGVMRRRSPRAVVP